MRRAALMIGCLALAGCGVAQPSPRIVFRLSAAVAPTFAANQRTARAFAQHQLSAVPLPPGAARTGMDPSAGGVLEQPQSRPGIGQLIDRHAFWQAPGSPQALVAWLRAHPPAGTRLFSWGSGGVRGQPDVWTLGFDFDHLPSGVAQAELDVAVAAARGGSAVRVDSFAAGLVPRPAWEHVPTNVASVVVTVRRYDGTRTYPLATVSRPRVLHHLVTLFNRFPIVQPGTVIACPMITGSTPLLHFSFMSRQGAELAQATESGCLGLSFSVGARSGPALASDVDLTQTLWSQHILPVCSSLSVHAEPLTRFPAPVEYSLPFLIRDTAAGACGLRGYPTVRLRGPAGWITPRVTRIPAGHPVLPPTALLEATQPAPTSFGWPAVRGCRALRFDAVQLRLPGVATPFVVRLPHPISACRGRITVASI